MSNKKLEQCLDLLLELPIQTFSTNSEWVAQNHVFVCREGAVHDSHGYVTHAIENGAIAIIATKPVQATVPVIVTDSYYQSVSLIKAYYRFPHHQLKHIGITGTNGKTTIAYGLQQILMCQCKSSYIGTLGVKYAEKFEPLDNTTPDAVTLLSLFDDMVNAGVQLNVMELSSHALAQDRAGFVPLQVGVISNIGRDHLDYHRTIDGYVQAKLQLIDRIKPGGTLVVNLDDPHAGVAIERAKLRNSVMTFSIGNHEADVVADEVQATQFGNQFTMYYQGEHTVVDSQMPFRFNVENQLAMASVLLSQGWRLNAVAAALSRLTPINGRSQFISLDNRATALVDYAHNYDGLQALFQGIDVRQWGKVITVIGVTGDRIREAAQIGQLCAEHSDVVIFTSDNPLGEMQEDIFRALTSRVGDTPYYEVSDRLEAIQLAKQLSRSHDLLLLCGKGHELHQHVTANKIGRQSYIGDRAAVSSEGKQ
ncbi:Mur ligase family protein [Vibrio paucivorans]